MTDQTPSTELGLTLLKMVRSKLTVDALARAMERADERYNEAALSAFDWAGKHPLHALDVAAVLLGGIRGHLVDEDLDNTFFVERREAVGNALAALEDLIEAFNPVHEPEGEPVAAG